MIIPTTSSSLVVLPTPTAMDAAKRMLDRRLFGFGDDDSSSGGIAPQSQTAPGVLDPAISSATASMHDAATKAASSLRSQYLSSSTETAAPAKTCGADDSVWETGKIAGELSDKSNDNDSR